MLLDPNEYLKENFDVSKLTVPNIRSVLVEHDVDFPSNATKSELIDIFNDEVKPNATKILKRYNVKPSSSNIIDMTTSPNTSASKRYIEPSPGSDRDKIIPAKRQSETVPQKKPKRKTRRVVSGAASESGSPTNSFLSIEKFEINENDNIFKGPIDNTVTTLLPKTKYAKKSKASSKDLLAKFDKSLPSSKVLKPSTDSSNVKKKSISSSTTPLKSNSDDEYPVPQRANETLDPADFVNNVYDPIGDKGHLDDLDLETNDIQLDNTFDYKGNNVVLLDDIFTDSNPSKKELTGPTKNIKDSITISSSEDESEEVFPADDKNDGVLVSTIDVKSLSSLETNDISFSDNSIKVEDEELPVDAPVEGEESHIDTPVEETATETEVTPKVEKIEEAETKEEVKEKKEEVKEKKKPTIDTKPTFFQKTFRILLLTFLFTNFLFSGLWMACLREIKINTGYCGFEKPAKMLDIWGKIPKDFQESLLPIKPYVNNLEDGIIGLIQFECQSCPEYGTCTKNRLRCNAGYLKKSSYESLFGFVPLEETCEFDTLRKEKLDYMFKYTLSYLHRHNDRQLTLNEVHDYLKSTKPSSMTSEEFEEYWEIFVDYELSKDEELNINFNTKEITLSHRTPTEYYTRTFGNVERGKTSMNLFQKTPPTVDVKSYYTASK